MAKASIEVTCSECGKTYKVEKKCSNRREADEFESWVASQDQHLCSECYGKMMAKKRQEERDAENKKAAENSKDLPPLSGSEKQIAWATTIRAKALEKFKTEFRICVAKQRLESKWWIDHRFCTNVEILGNMIAEDMGVSVKDALSNPKLSTEWMAKIKSAENA